MGRATKGKTREDIKREGREVFDRLNNGAVPAPGPPSAVPDGWTIQANGTWGAPGGGGGGAVDSVNGQVGDVVLDAGDIGADPAGTAAAAVAAHEAAADPHPQYQLAGGGSGISPSSPMLLMLTGG